MCGTLDATGGVCKHISAAQPQAVEMLSELPAGRGIVLFADQNGKPLTLLITADIRRIVRNRLFVRPAQQEQKPSADISGIVRSVTFWRYCNDFVAGTKFLAIARSVYPDDYKEQFPLARQNYVKIDSALKWPFFSVTDRPVKSKSQKLFGLFANRKAACEFIDIIHEAFGLCRRGALLEKGQNPRSCSYLQMERCDAPCLGGIACDRYFRRIEDAVTAAGQGVDFLRSRLVERMRHLSDMMKYEQAQLVKKQLARLDRADAVQYRWTGGLERLSILHIDRSEKIIVKGIRKKVQSYAAYLINYASVLHVGDFTAEQTDMLAEKLAAVKQSLTPFEDKDILTEHLALLGGFLYRSKPPGIWLDCRKGLPPIQKDIIEQKRESSEGGKFGLI